MNINVSIRKVIDIILAMIGWLKGMYIWVVSS